MKPSVGRIVHFKNNQQVCWAAIITAVNDVRDGRCDLSVFVPRTPDSVQPTVQAGGELTYSDVREGDHAGEWHWPEREGG